MSMTNLQHRTTSTGPRKRDKETNISKNRKWKSFRRVPHLLQYIPSGSYYGRVKVKGRVVRCSLETDVFTTAKLKLSDFIKSERKRSLRSVMPGTFAEARAKFEADIDADHTLKESSKRYRRYCVRALVRTWPELEGKAPGSITESDCQLWARKFAGEYDEQFFNNTLSTLRQILELAGLGRDENPAYAVKRLGVKPKELQLPEPAEFESVLHAIETAGARQSKHCADFVRFLAFSGCRLSEAREVRFRDVDLERGEIRVRNAKRALTSAAASFRSVPIIPPMRELLVRLKTDRATAEDRVCVVGECEKSLTRACKVVGISRITHHDLRHLFATRCIEAGVDIPTVSRWLGHSDGGVLAMRTYGHLRDSHSAQMASQVKF